MSSTVLVSKETHAEISSILLNKLLKKNLVLMLDLVEMRF